MFYVVIGTMTILFGYFSYNNLKMKNFKGACLNAFCAGWVVAIGTLAAIRHLV
jgi:hypothetical protein